MVLAALAATGVVGPAVCADDSPFGPRPGVLLLRNGELIEGDITLAGDRYDVTVPSGQMHIRRSEVQFVGRSMLECYERRKASISIDKVQDHLELADWCLRHRLYEQAALALADAVATDSSHPRIGLLERRLKLELEQQASPESHAKEAESELPSSRDLDRMVQGLPAGTVEAFTATIQPMLLNHCSTAGCHGPQGTAALRLLRIPTGKAPSRRATQRNLYAVLSAVDQDHPAQSPLATAPMRPHGQAKSAGLHQPRGDAIPAACALGLHDRQSILSAIGYGRAQRSPPVPLGGPASHGERPRHARPANRPSRARCRPGSPIWPTPGRSANRAVPNQPTAAKQPIPKRPTKPTNAEPAAEGDPFDPQAFNDRYLKGPAE